MYCFAYPQLSNRLTTHVEVTGPCTHSLRDFVCCLTLTSAIFSNSTDMIMLRNLTSGQRILTRSREGTDFCEEDDVIWHRPVALSCRYWWPNDLFCSIHHNRDFQIQCFSMGQTTPKPAKGAPIYSAFIFNSLFVFRSQYVTILHLLPTFIEQHIILLQISIIKCAFSSVQIVKSSSSNEYALLEYSFKILICAHLYIWVCIFSLT